jgi:hypothetical protein
MTFSTGALLTTGASVNYEKFQNSLRVFES